MSDETHHHVIVIGTGFAGLGMAIRLRAGAPRHDRWRPDRRWPGAAVRGPDATW
ncbi:MAG: hypothetical protein ACRDSF_09070 [Pseudonocardiaceae bacterium]